MNACDCHNVGANDDAGYNMPKRWAICDGETLTTLSADFADLFAWSNTYTVPYSDYIKLTASQQKELDDLSFVTIVDKPTVKVDINIDAPTSAYQGDDVVIMVTVTNTGTITAELGAELYEGDTLIGACGGTVEVTPGASMSQQFTRTMPDHDWNLTAKVISEPPIDATKDFTILLGEPCNPPTCLLELQ